MIAFAVKDMQSILRSLITYLCIALNDILIKLFAGGMHDHEGLDWINVAMFIGCIPAFIILLVATLRSDENVFAKIAAIVIFPLLLTLHLKYLSNLGLGRYYWYD